MGDTGISGIGKILSAKETLVTGAAGTEKEAKVNFEEMMDRAGLQTAEKFSTQNTTDNSESVLTVTVADVTEDYEKYQYKEKLIQNKENCKEITSEKEVVEERANEFAEDVNEVLQEEFGVTEEEIAKAMEALGLQYVDLLKEAGRIPEDYVVNSLYLEETENAENTETTEVTVQETVIVDEVHEHDYRVVESKCATCEEKGKVVYCCFGCGDTYTEYSEALGHTPGEWEMVEDAQLFSDGVQVRRCSVCNAELEQYVIPQESGMSLQFIVMGDLGVIVAIVAGAAWSIHKKKVRKMGRMRSRVV